MTDRRSQAAVLLVVGAMALYLGRSDAALAYVKGGLQPLLLASGTILGMLAAAAVVRRGPQQHGPRVAWLLVLPPLALVLIAPPALGAFAAGRQSIQPPPTIQAGPTDQAAPGGDQALFPPLVPPDDGAAVPITLTEYMMRDYEAPHSLAGVRIRLVGFVTPQRRGRDGYLLTRFAINCCAADATALRVAIHGDQVPRAPDTWLEVEGRWQQRTSDDPDRPSSETPLLVAESVRETEQPSEPYESGFSY
ncbi:MAG TPA: TIGR03943 family protein [Actinomycetes bacterium]|nr:TIGR03943 family protein [Actinomycetes bacterium]